MLLQLSGDLPVLIVVSSSTSCPLSCDGTGRRSVAAALFACGPAGVSVTATVLTVPTRSWRLPPGAAPSRSHTHPCLNTVTTRHTDGLGFWRGLRCARERLAVLPWREADGGEFPGAPCQALLS